MGFPCGFLVSLCSDIPVAQLFVGLFDCDIIKKKSANKCSVWPLAIRQFWGANSLGFHMGSPLTEV